MNSEIYVDSNSIKMIYTLSLNDQKTGETLRWFVVYDLLTNTFMNFIAINVHTPYL